MDEITFNDLDRWERYYLMGSIGRRYICMPKDSKVVDRLIEKGIILGVGLVFGRYAEFSKTWLGQQVLDDFLGELATAPADAAEGGES